jgi:hypothetical protein
MKIGSVAVSLSLLFLVLGRPEAAGRAPTLDVLCKRMKVIGQSQPTQAELDDLVLDLRRAHLAFQEEVMRFAGAADRDKVDAALLDLMKKQKKITEVIARKQSIKVGVDAFCVE